MGIRGRAVGRLAESGAGPLVDWVDDSSPYFLRKLMRGPDPIRDALSALGRGIVFAQIGANDGRSGDPIYRRVRWAGWRGVTVEAVPRMYERLAETYRRYPQVTPVHAAIGTTSGEELPFYYLNEEPGDPFFAERIGSFRREHLAKHPIPRIEERIQTCMVSTTTMDELIGAHVPDVDLIHIDTEGYDEQLIPTIDFDRWPFHTIMFENAHMSDQGRQLCHELLRKHGFREIAASRMDRLWRR